MVSPFSQTTIKSSRLSAVDPRLKIIIMIVFMSSIILINHWAALGYLALFAFFLQYLGTSNLRTVWNDALMFRLFFPVIIIIHGFTTEGTIVFSIGKLLAFTTQGLFRGIFFTFKLMVISIFTAPMIRSTIASHWLKGIAGLTPDIPFLRRFSITLGFAFQMLPLLYDQIQQVRLAQRCRGLREGTGIKNRVRGLIPVLIPQISLIMNRSHRFTQALITRGFSMDRKPNALHPLKLKRDDYLATALFLVLTFLTGVHALIF